MRILLDECVPAALARELPGHIVSTVQRQRLSGLRNGALLLRAAQDFDVFLTLDRSIPHQQSLPGDLALITLRVVNNRVETVVALAPSILRALDTIRPGGRVLLEPHV